MNKIVKRYWVKCITLSGSRIEISACEPGDIIKRIKFIINRYGTHVIEFYPELDKPIYEYDQVNIGISNYKNNYCYQFNLKWKEERESRKKYFVDIGNGESFEVIFDIYYAIIRENFTSNMENVELIFAVVEPDKDDYYGQKKETY